MLHTPEHERCPCACSQSRFNVKTGIDITKNQFASAMLGALRLVGCEPTPSSGLPLLSRASLDAHLQKWLPNMQSIQKWSHASTEVFLLVVEFEFWLSHALAPP